MIMMMMMKMMIPNSFQNLEKDINLEVQKTHEAELLQKDKSKEIKEYMVGMSNVLGFISSIRKEGR